MRHCVQMNSAEELTDLMGIRTPPESMRAGRNRTWSASDFPQLTQTGMRSAEAPSPSIATTFADGMAIAQAVQMSEPRGLYRWQSTFSARPAQMSTRESV